MRQIRNMAGVIDEQEESVKAVNDKLNNFNLDGVESDITKLKIDVNSIGTNLDQVEISVGENTAHLTTVDSTLDNHARNIKANSDAISVLEPNVEALNKELPTEFTLYRTGTGKIQLQCEREDSTVLDSNILDMIIPESYNIVSGTTNRSFRLEISFSDGTTATTNDFIIPEGGGTDVTVTGIKLTKVTDNTFRASIVLSDTTEISSGAITTVNSVSGTFANNQLVIKVNGVSSIPIAIDTTGAVYTAGSGIKIASGTISVDDTVVALKSDISDMQTKTEAVATYATKTSVAQLQSAVGDAFNDVDFDDANGNITFTALDGQQTALTLSTSLIWEQISLSDMTDHTVWHVGDQMIGGTYTFLGSSSITQLEQISMVCVKAGSVGAVFEGTALAHNLGSNDGTPLRSLTIQDGVLSGFAISNVHVALGTPQATGATSSKVGWKTTHASVSGGKSISTLTTVVDLIANARIGDSIIAPTTEVKKETITNTPIHIVTTSGNVQTGSTIYINCLEMTVISRNDDTVIANGYGRYSYTTTSGSKSETTIQQIKISSNGAVEILVASTWSISKTIGTISKLDIKLVH